MCNCLAIQLYSDRYQSTQFLSRSTAAGLLKRYFPTNQVTSEGPETSVLELLTRGIYVTWLNSFRKFVIYVFFFTCQTMKIELGPQHQWMRLNESFSCVISDLVQPSRYLGKLFVCVSVFDGQSSCTQVTDNITKNMLR